MPSIDQAPLMHLDWSIKNVKAVGTDDTSVIIEGYANVVVKDRAGDVITSSAWNDVAALTNYQKNPIILFGHDHRRPIGKCLELTPDAYGLHIRAEIFKESDPAIFSAVVNEILKTFSIGFRCLEARWDDATEIFVIEKLELYEISVVAVPCNQDSTFSLAKSMNGQDYLEFRKHFITEQPSEKQLGTLEQIALAYGFVKTENI
ncbi:head maturation protease [Pectobacterium phage My1]|uniref:Putative prohead protease n=1 Tax=Pectobacterium phage My1 TaxID=1204539 RepID=J9QPZ3_9CAUD|nr:head maturation protease [Pectobacterium phage My1]AFQ22301.1 putative prohead protease [Pectobacterium phage My1]